MRRAAIYARISDARDGDTAGVDRQEADCRALATERGWEVVGVYIDNDRSAYSGKRRPAFEDMLTAVQAGGIDVVICWAADRLYRRLNDLERLVDDLGGVQVATVKSGRVDLSTADGRMTARILGSVSQHESEKKSERIARAYADRARSGKFPGGTRRYGYNSTCTATVPEEADELRKAYEHIAAGGSLRSKVLDLRARGVTGAKGAPFTAQSLREALLRPLNAGHVNLRGQIILNASTAPRIVDPELWEQVRAILLDPARRTGRGRPSRSLLAGIAQCSKCGGPIYASGRQRHRDKIYRCTTNYCLTRKMSAVDDYVQEEVLQRLEASADQIAAELAAAAPQPPTADMAEASRLRRQLDSLSDLLVAGDLDAAAYAAADHKLRETLRVIEGRISAGSRATLPILGDALPIREAWQAANIEDRRTLLKALLSVRLDKVTGPEAKRDPRAGIEVIWK